MVPRIHRKGKSFRGAAQYVLHDKDTLESRDRVEWTQTRNLATDDPDTAWRVMAATSMDQDRLKAEAGVKNTGRKSKDHVLHVTLSWDESESEELTQDEMMKAVNQAIHALDAQDRQALIAAHNDTPSPHVHILINRVSQEDGRMLSSSKEKLKLSAWAQTYEQERGQILCDQRVINNEARGMAKYTRDQTSHRPYHIHEVEISNDNKPGFDQAKAEQIAKDATLAAEGRDREERRRQAWAQMEERHTAAVEQLSEQQQRSLWSATNQVHTSYRPSWEAMHTRHAEELKAWQGNEDRFIGRIKNAFRATDWRGMMGEDRREKLSEAYEAFSSSGARLEALKRAQEDEKRRLRAEELQAEQERQDAIRRQAEIERLDQLALFEAERQSAILTQQLEDAAGRAEWQKRNDDRRAAFEQLQERDVRDIEHESEANPPTAQPEGETAEDRLTDAQREWLDRYRRERDIANDNVRDQDRER